MLFDYVYSNIDATLLATSCTFSGFSYIPTGVSPSATFRDGGSGGVIVAKTSEAAASVYMMPNVLIKTNLYVDVNNAEVVAYIG